MDEHILEKIYNSTLRFLEPLDSTSTYTTIVDEAVRLVGAVYASIILSENGELVRSYSSSHHAYRTLTRKRGFTYEAFKTGEVVIADITEMEKFHPELREQGIKTTVFIPLSYKKQAIGVLTINSKNKITSTAKELEILKLFGSMASLAIRKAQLYDETNKALTLRDIFMSSAAHELRTPLTSISGYIQLLLKKIGNTQSSEAKWVKELSNESQRMIYLVNELLEVNRHRSNTIQYNFSEHSLLAIIDEVLRLFSHKHRDYTVQLANNLHYTNDTVIADKERFSQALLHIMDNAANFSTNKKAIQIVLTDSKQYITLKIIDFGRGISSEDLPLIFEGFYKGTNSNLGTGLGLGLYMTKTIIKEHKGTIEARSKLHKGTTFTIKIPRIAY